MNKQSGRSDSRSEDWDMGSSDFREDPDEQADRFSHLEGLANRRAVRISNVHGKHSFHFVCWPSKKHHTRSPISLRAGPRWIGAEVSNKTVRKMYEEILRSRGPRHGRSS